MSELSDDERNLLRYYAATERIIHGPVRGAVHQHLLALPPHPPLKNKNVLGYSIYQRAHKPQGIEIAIELVAPACRF